MGELFKPFAWVAAGLLGWSAATGNQIHGPGGSAGDANNQQPWPGYPNTPPPVATGSGLIGGLFEGKAFSESFFVVLLIVAFIVGVRYLKR